MRRLLIVIPVVWLLTACGTPSADLFVVSRTGTVPGARLVLHVSDGGYVTCNDGAQKEISSDQLIQARGIVHLLQADDEKGRDQGKDGPIDVGLRLAPRAGSVLRYSVRGEHGTVAFADNSAGQPPVFYALALFTRTIAKGVCGLPR